jgi:hypothetical protein
MGFGSKLRPSRATEERTMASNIQEVYEAAINDDPCGHGHKTFEAAEKCVRRTIRRAKKGQKFYNSDFAAKLDPKNDEDVAIWVKRHLMAK